VQPHKLGDDQIDYITKNRVIRSIDCKGDYCKLDEVDFFSILPEVHQTYIL
jgi:hypothetical protein